MSDVTRILQSIEEGDPKAADELLPLVYNELRKLAAAKMAREKPGQTLQTTSLVHEAYLRLVDVEQAQNWNSRGHFFGAVAAAMRRILVDRARRRSTQKQGGDRQRLRVPLDELAKSDHASEVVAIDEALQMLAIEHPHVAELVERKYFGGQTLDDIAAAMGISVRTAHRHWAFAKAWLRNAIRQIEFE